MEKRSPKDFVVGDFRIQFESQEECDDFVDMMNKKGIAWQIGPFFEDFDNEV